MDLPDLSSSPDRKGQVVDLSDELDPIILADMDYNLARAVPGAIYSSEHHAMIIPVPTARAAIVALALQPALMNTHPELVELRDTATQDVHIVDYATQLQIPIDAPVVHQTLLDAGHDWLEFDHEVNRPVPIKTGDVPDELWPRQDTDLGYAAAILNKHHGFLMGWTRGGGKTLGTAALIEANHYRSVLVASPNSAKFDTWLRELELRLPSHHILVLGNTPVKRAGALKLAKELHDQGHPFVLVVHHEALAIVAGKKSRPSDKGVTILDGWKKLKIQWDLKVVDESHRLKSSGRNGSQFHRAACKVPADNALALTGSLYENSWEELYGTLHFLFPGRYSNHWEDWNNRHLEYIDGYGKVFVGILEGHADPMGQELGVFTVIREKWDRTIHSEILVELSPAQRRAYDEMVEDMLTKLDDDTFVYAEVGVVQLTRLRQIAAGLDLLSNEISDSTKLDAAIAKIKKHPDHDFFVAVWHKAAAFSLADRLHAEGIPAFTITGDTPVAERTRMIAAARKLAGTARAGAPVVVIGTISTMGESVNLQYLNHVIRVELSFNPAVNRQVVDRVDRTGQEREVFCDDIIAKNTVDQSVVVPQLANKDAMRALFLGRGA